VEINFNVCTISPSTLGHDANVLFVHPTSKIYLSEPLKSIFLILFITLHDLISSNGGKIWKYGTRKLYIKQDDWIHGLSDASSPGKDVFSQIVDPMPSGPSEHLPPAGFSDAAITR
jgi:hypothetical protein